MWRFGKHLEDKLKKDLGNFFLDGRKASHTNAKFREKQIFQDLYEDGHDARNVMV
jgi:hypothetical protein